MPPPPPDLHDSGFVKKQILVRILAGLGLSLALIVGLYGSCALFVHVFGWSRFCETAWTSPPWALVSGVAAVPALVLLWEWRTVQRGKELVQQTRANDHFQSQFEDARARSEKDHEATQQQYELSLAQQLSGRFSDSIRLIAETDLNSRIGGIYSLERIAREAEEAYKGVIIKTLSAFVRQRTPSPHPLEQPDLDELEFGPDPPAADVQAAVEVLAGIGPWRGVVADFSSSQLAQLHAPRGEFSGAKLVYANLQDADLSCARLAGAQANGASLAGARLEGAYLEGANLRGADLAGASLASALLARGDLSTLSSGNKRKGGRGVHVEGANFCGADVRGTDLSGVHGVASWRGARYDANTRFPDGFDPAAEGMDLDEVDHISEKRAHELERQ